MESFYFLTCKIVALMFKIRMVGLDLVTTKKKNKNASENDCSNKFFILTLPFIFILYYQK